MTTIADEWRQEGEMRILKRQLTRRFGPVPGWVEAKLAQAEPDHLEEWGDRVLDAPSLEKVFEDQPPPINPAG